jgi:RNA-directed DNA polymerase
MAKTSGDIRTRWEWVEAAVWSERMLTALEDGVKGSKWYSLMDKVVALPTLRRAFARVKANRGAAGVDHVTVEGYEQHLEENLKQLAQRIRAGSYRPQAVRRVWIPKAGSRQQRPLGIPTVQDRVAQAVTLAVMEPIFERDFAEHSYGFRPGRGCKDGLRQVDSLLQQGYTWVVDADLSSYFDTIPHAGLMARVANKIADGAVLGLIERFLQAKVMETAAGWTPQEGTPQGAVLTPLTQKVISNSRG